MDENTNKPASEVKENIPSTPPKPPVPAKPEAPVEGNAPKSSGGGMSIKLVFLAFLGFLSLLLTVFYILLIVALRTGDVSNRLFVSLGIQDKDLQSTLYLITHSVFGVLTVFFLFSFLIRFFQFLTSEVKDVRRKDYVKKSVTSLVAIILLGATWTGLYVMIRDARVVSLDSINMIRTEPEILKGLSAPIKVKFNIGDNLFRQIDEKQVKQINWDFDGDEKTDRNGSEVFYTFKNKGKDDGKYTVKATVIYNTINNAKDQIFEAKREVIIANESIAAEIYASKEKGPAPLSVSFSGEGSVDPDGEVVFYEWDFNDDGVYEIKGADKARVEHVFQKLGNYKVKLRVQGANNDYDETEKLIEVTNPEKNLKARITSSQSKEGYAPYTIQLSGEQSFSRRGRILKYVWFIDGKEEVVVSRTLKWTFSNPGQYLIRLLVENDLDEKDEEEIIIVVEPPLKNSNVVIKTVPRKRNDDKYLAGEAPFAVSFDASESDIEDAIEWKWDFDGDGVFDAFQESVQYVFREDRDYDARLTIVDIDGDEFSQNLLVRVQSPGVKAFIDADPVAGEVPLTVRFDGSGSSVDKGDIINYIWEFPGQEPIPYGAQIDYEFPVVGVYEVKLTVLTDDNQTDTVSKFISVRAQTIESQFEASPLVGDAPLKVDFDSSSSKGNIVEYRWDFGDGVISRQQHPVHTYTVPGKYNVVLKVVDALGVVSELSKQIEVR